MSTQAHWLIAIMAQCPDPLSPGKHSLQSEPVGLMLLPGSDEPLPFMVSQCEGCSELSEVLPEWQYNGQVVDLVALAASQHPDPVSGLSFI